MTRGLFATELGERGPRLVFLHGLFGQGKNWTAIGKALTDAARVTLVDLPDHGRSPWTETFSYPGMAASVADLLRTRYPSEPVTLVGHSMGGKVAMMLALEHAELVTRLCVVDVSPVRYDTLASFAEYVEGMRELDLAALATRAEADRSLERRVPDPTVRGFLLQNLRRVPHSSGGPRWQWQMNLALLGDLLDEL